MCTVAVSDLENGDLIVHNRGVGCIIVDGPTNAIRLKMKTNGKVKLYCRASNGELHVRAPHLYKDSGYVSEAF